MTVWTTQSDSADVAMSKAEEYASRPDGERRVGTA